jgi:class 3 adenylate cyclase/tetratricopeptide (TPR) repeat protein
MSDLLAWLDQIGLSKYASLLAENDVDLDVLQRLSEDDLRELGLPLGARRKILYAVKQLPEQGGAKSRAAREGSQPPSAQGPERRQITVLFSDVVGSTALAEQVDVEDLRALILTYQRACAEAIEQHGGYIAQYLGDGVLAYFGYPHAHEDDAVRAVRASLAAVEKMLDLNARLIATHGVGLQIRVGVHTGLVVTGEVGAGATREPLAIGEAPNVAARIQNLATSGTVVVSEATWRLIEGFFTAEPLGMQVLKGVSRPIPLYRIVAAIAITNPFDARVARSLTPLVSRDVELSFLRQRWQQATDGEGQIVLVQGEAGIGKSRLMRVFREELAGADARIITLSCSAHHQASAFYPLIEPLSRALDLVSREGAEVRLGKLTAFLDRLSLPVDRLRPPLAALLGVVEDGATAEPDLLRRAIFDAVVQIVIALAEERPVLFVIEDAHWIDPSTHELIGHLLDAIQDRQVMVNLTARPEYRPPWLGRSNFSVLSVSRLSRRQTETMVRRVAGSELAPEVVAELASRSEGVPLFVEELTRSVIDVRGEARTVAVPATLQEALAARLDRLTPVRELIQVAALLGRVFDAEVVRAATGMGEKQLDSALVDLTESGLIYRRSDPRHRVFEFKHALIQEAALNTLVRQRRALLHQRIADALQELHPEIVQQHPEIVARHVQEAGDDRQAWSLWRAAGELAAQRSASLESVTHFRSASECLERLTTGTIAPSEEAETYLGLAGALMRAEGYRAETLARAAQSTQRAARASGSVLLQWRAILQTAPVFYGTGRNGEYLGRLEEFERTVSKGDDPWLQAAVLVTRGIAHYNRGEFAPGAEALAAAMNMTRDLPPNQEWRVGDGYVSIVALGYATRCVSRLGRLEEALELGLASERNGRSLDHPFSVAWAIHNLCNAYAQMGDHAAVLAAAEEVISISRRHGFSARLGNGLMRRGLARAYLGDLARGVEEFREGYALWRGPGAVFHVPEVASELCDVLLLDGRAADACAVLDDVDALVRGTDEAAALAECQRLRGMLALAGGESAAAERWLESAIATARKQAARLFELRATTALAELLASGGRGAEASRRLMAVYATFTEGHRAPALRAARAVLDRLPA